MYELVKAQAESRKDRTLRNVILAVVVISVIVLVPMIWIMGSAGRYRTYVEKLSDSTIYAYNNRSLYAVMDGEVRWINLKNDYKIYTYITVSGRGVEQYRIPEEEPAITLDYGNGSSLKLWDLEPVEGSRTHRLFLEFEDSTGYSYAYTSEAMDLEAIKIRYLEVKTNKVVEKAEE